MGSCKDLTNPPIGYELWGLCVCNFAKIRWQHYQALHCLYTRDKRHSCCWSALHFLPPVLLETGKRGPGHDEDGSTLCFATELGVVVSHVPLHPPPCRGQDRWCVLISITIASVRVPVCNFSPCPMYKCTVCRRWRCVEIARVGLKWRM